MAKLRSNHNRSKQPFAGLLVRVFLMIGVLAILFVMLYRLMNNLEVRSAEANDSYPSMEQNSNFDNVVASSKNSNIELVPLGSNAQIINHTYYTLGYNERYEQAEWVSYLLTRENLKIPNVKRADRFEIDPKVKTGSADYYDYRGSGYSRGHLAPAGDMAQNERAMKESFYMSNMSPQEIPFNGGIWRELEECVRDWAYANEELYIVTGPIFDRSPKYIGQKSKVAVPTAYFKVIVDHKGNDRKAIGFIMPNEMSERPIMDYAVSVDEVESRTRFDFFDTVLNDNIEEKLESEVDTDDWKVSEKRYQLRINNWNKR